jgi:ATP-binding cassette subfamily B protein/subfamily B ATP-binding cassette protein MsbA
MNFLLPLCTSAATLAAMLALLWRIDPLLAVTASVVAPAIGLVVWRFARALERTSYDQSVAQAEVMSAAEQTLTALPLVRSFSREPHEDRRFQGLWQIADRRYLRTVLTQAGFKSAVDLTMACGVAAVTVLGGWRVIEGRMTVGALVVAMSYLAAFYAPIETIAYISQSFAAAAAGARRVFEILDADDAPKEAHDAVELPRSSRGIEVKLEEVTFGYEPDRPVLRSVSITARAGEMVALVGTSGAGKSTLVSLIPRLADPWHGRVLIGGRDAQQLTLASLRDQVAIVLQEALLLPVSIADNIRYGRPDATRREVELAAVAASAHEFITRLPDGYDTVLAERGATLSGGERQRIAIARALLKNAPIVILDEPTASLDAHTEAAIFDAIARLTEGRTTFVIAHRLSTARRANRILVLEGGSIAEEGRHEELVARGGLYHALAAAQSKGVMA